MWLLLPRTLLVSIFHCWHFIVYVLILCGIMSNGVPIVHVCVYLTACSHLIFYCHCPVFVSYSHNQKPASRPTDQPTDTPYECRCIMLFIANKNVSHDIPYCTSMILTLNWLLLILLLSAASAHTRILSECLSLHTVCALKFTAKNKQLNDFPLCVSLQLLYYFINFTIIIIFSLMLRIVFVWLMHKFSVACLNLNAISMLCV